MNLFELWWNLTPIGATINIIRRSIEADHAARVEVHSVAIGWNPDLNSDTPEGFQEGCPLENGTPTYYRIVREAKK